MYFYNGHGQTPTTDNLYGAYTMIKLNEGEFVIMNLYPIPTKSVT